MPYPTRKKSAPSSKAPGREAAHRIIAATKLVPQASFAHPPIHPSPSRIRDGAQRGAPVYGPVRYTPARFIHAWLALAVEQRDTYQRAARAVRPNLLKASLAAFGADLRRASSAILLSQKVTDGSQAHILRNALALAYGELGFSGSASPTPGLFDPTLDPLVAADVEALTRLRRAALASGKIDLHGAYLRSGVAPPTWKGKAGTWVGYLVQQCVHAYETVFARKAGLTRSGGGPGGPFVRFVVATAHELGLEVTPETVARHYKRRSK